MTTNQNLQERKNAAIARGMGNASAGKLFAMEYMDIEPKLITVAKATAALWARLALWMPRSRGRLAPALHFRKEVTLPVVG